MSDPKLPKNNRTPAALQAQIDALEKRFNGFIERVQRETTKALAELDVRVEDLESAVRGARA